MKYLTLLSLFILGSCTADESNPNELNPEIVEESRIADMRVVYRDFWVEIRTYTLDGHERILTRTNRGSDDNHSENCRKCNEDPFN